jgi:hypothetical protein
LPDANYQVSLDEITGFVVIREENPWKVDHKTGLPVHGSQPPNIIVERFKRDGTLVDRRVVPPTIRLVWGDAWGTKPDGSVSWWRRLFRRSR